MQPNLFIVGFQKCGSSSLFDKLVEHEDIKGTTPKETFALCDNNYQRFDIDKNISNSTFSWDNFRNESQNKTSKYFLEGSVINFYQERAINHIKDLNEKKVIFIIRNPIDRFRSTFDYYGKRLTNLGVINNLEEYYDIVRERSESIDVEGAKYAIEHGRYSKYIDRWTYEIGSENILLVGFKNLVSDTEDELKKISNFLDINKFKTNSIAFKNKTEVVKNKALNHYARRFFSGTGLGSTWMGSLYSRLNTTTKKTAVSQKLNLELRTFYQEEFIRYQDLF